MILKWLSKQLKKQEKKGAEVAVEKERKKGGKMKLMLPSCFSLAGKNTKAPNWKHCSPPIFPTVDDSTNPMSPGGDNIEYSPRRRTICLEISDRSFAFLPGLSPTLKLFSLHSSICVLQLRPEESEQLRLKKSEAPNRPNNTKVCDTAIGFISLWRNLVPCLHATRLANIGSFEYQK